ncbi:M28 family metallopeptidase [Paraglaciecola hydrolytica]|uniref:Peptidase M28 domain-containing protein n=1 Tax=Paraglaciecola hydrolytica TaxID=1799789 RepID=A0A136A5F6_9ALTE|nr:M20/M25/M40 family metallo-hydrolase [Paraglaciecola hydrolytica]KXI30482.1 hypothetical protein AX660_10995 [Paraglaciecola hydrolytica]
MKKRRVCLGLVALFVASSAFSQTMTVMDYLQNIVGEKGLGARVAGSEQEKQTAAYIEQQWLMQGLAPTVSSFTLKDNKHSANVVVDIKGKSDKILIIGGHYDSTAAKEGSLGAADNATSTAILLALSQHLRKQNLSVTVRLIAFGAEESGLLGSKAYVAQLGADEISNLLGMINLDGAVGGDNLYIHSAHSDPYKCPQSTQAYSSDASLRDAMMVQAKKSFTDANPFALHPAYPGYPEGEAGGWSDHAPFACIGLPVVDLEATNFSINGKEGYDGYSQSTHPELWDCFSTEKMGACDRESETKWGGIWHTQYDRLDKLLPLFGQRIETQLEQNLKLLSDFIESYNPPAG